MQTINEQLLTAYALDELPLSVRMEVKAYLARHPEAEAEVEAIRTAAGQLREQLMTELQSTPPPKVEVRPPVRVRRRWVAPLAIAASVACALGIAAVVVEVRRAQPPAVAMSNMRSFEPKHLQDRLEFKPVPQYAEQFREALRDSDPNPNPSIAAGTPTPGQAPGVAHGVTANAGPSAMVRSPTAPHTPLSGVQNDNIFTSQSKPDARVDPTYAADSVLRLDVPGPVESPVYRGPIQHNTESYDRIVDNPFLDAAGNPLSTFSIDVDTASYSNVRRFLNGGQLPPKDAVRIEEMVNYFPYAYEGPKDADKPFAASVEIAGCPWNAQHRLVRVGIKGREIPAEQRPASNLVFLIDVSGSMNEPNKLPLVKQSLRELVNQLDSRDRVAMVVYAGSSGLVLESTPVGGDVSPQERDALQKQLDDITSVRRLGAEDQSFREVKQKIDQLNEKIRAIEARTLARRQAILSAIDRLEAGGSTNGGAGIELAYLTAQSGFIKDGVNRVILATDGDFNVGVTDQGALTRLIEEKAKGGVFLSVLGFGMGNTKDSTMEKLADKGNGNYAYIDTLQEAKKVLVEQMSGTLVTIAKDVKIQVEFNPAKVAGYRLIGYENRLLAKEDFNDDRKDAGEIGAGHTVTALYEVVPVGAKPPAAPGVDPLKYQQPASTTKPSDETLTLKLRYKAPDAPLEQGTSKLLEFPITDAGRGYAQASEDFKFAAAVVGFGMVLRDSPHKGTATLSGVIELAGEGKGADPTGYRQEFIQLVEKAKQISGK